MYDAEATGGLCELMVSTPFVFPGPMSLTAVSRCPMIPENRPMATEQPNTEQRPKEETSTLVQFLSYTYGVICRSCGAKVLDPDKKKGQTVLKLKCPSCNKTYVEPKKLSKREKKRAAREEKAACRAKY